MDPLAASFDRWRVHGDLAALGAVFDAIAPRLLPVALHLCGHMADAEDALQQTFLLAMDKAAAFDRTQRLEPWLAGLLQNVVRNQSRSQHRRRSEELPDLASGELGPLDRAEREELATRLRTHVDALPADQRQVLRLVLQHGMSAVAIAEVLEVPPGTVRMRMHRGLEALRRVLPASLAVLLATTFATRGLAAVKSQVMAAGAAKAAAAAAAAGAASVAASGSAVVVGGALVMKKLVALLVLVGLVSSLWWFGSSPATPVEGAEPPPPPAPLAAEANGPRVDERDVANAPQPERVVATPAAGSEVEPSPTEIRGLVIDAQTRAPMVNSEVVLLRFAFDSYFGIHDEMDDGGLPPHDALATAKCDSDGRFTLSVDRAVSYRVRASAPDHAERVVAHCTGGSFVVIELDRPATILCTVRTESGPLSNAVVRLADEETLIDRASSITDAAGIARFVGQCAGRVTLAVLDPYMLFATTSLDVSGGAEHRVELRTKPGRLVRGRVHDAATHAPVANARVLHAFGLGPPVVTDATGRFEVGWLADGGALRLLVRAEGYAEAAVRRPYGSTGEFEVDLVRGASIRGRLVDEQGRSLAEAVGFVSARTNQGFVVKRISTDAEGRFTATGLLPGTRYWLVACAPARGTQVRLLARELVDGEKLDLPDLVLFAESTIEGRVVDDQGRSLAGIWIECNGLAQGSNAWSLDASSHIPIRNVRDRITRTDANGRFHIGSLAAGEYALVVRQPNSPGAVERAIRIDNGENREGVDFTIASGHPIAGVVVPVSGGIFGAQFALHVTSIDVEPPIRGFAEVNLDGSFRIEGMQAGRYSVELLTRPEAQVLPPGTIVEAGREDLRIVLEPAHAVAGKVVDGRGKPISARVVCMSGPDHVEVAKGIASPDGSFRLEVPASFNGAVAAFPIEADWKPVRLDGVVADRNDLVLQVHPLGSPR